MNYEEEYYKLTAHVEEIRRVRSIPRSEFEHDGRRVQLLIEAIDKAPTTTLSRRDAHTQWETCERLAAALRLHGLTEAEGLVNAIGERVNRQAEEKV